MERPPQAPCPACGYALAADPCGQCGGCITPPEGHGRVDQRRRFAAFELAHGFVGFWRGALILFRPEFAGCLRTPILVNLLAFLLCGAGLFFAFLNLFGWAAEGDWGWLEWLKAGGAAAAAFLLTVLTMLLVAPTLIEALVAPFLDPLAEAAERQMCGPGFRPLGISPWRSAWLGMKASAQTIALSLAVLIPTWLIAVLVPGGFFVAALLSAGLTAVVWFELPFARRGWGLRHRLLVLRRNWARALGFGLAFQLGMTVPVFNILLLTPAAAMGATLLYFHFEKDPNAL